MFKINNKNEIAIVRGDTGKFKVDITDAKGEPYDLEPGDQLTLTVRKTPSSDDILIQKHGDEIEFTPENTARLPYGRYVYDLELRLADGQVDTIIQPTLFEILPEVTY